MLPRSARGGSRRFKSRRLSLESLESRQMLTITVTTLVDELDGSIDDGDISLRDAIAAAPDGEVIDFAVDGVITMDEALGEISIDRNLVILGPGASELTIANPPTSRVFSIETNDVIISGVTMSGISSETIDDRAGGAIYASIVSLTLADVVIEQNTVGGPGGAIYVANGGQLQISESSIRNNQGSAGGGIFAALRTLAITDSTISGNTSTRDGGGLYFWAYEVDVTDSVISENQSDNHGGGLRGFLKAYRDPGHLQIERSQISGNTAAANGGGGSLNGEVELRETRVENNRAGANGGGWYLSGYKVFRAYDSELNDNQALAGTGGAVSMDPDFPNDPGSTFQRSVITGNQAQSHGGGLYLSAGGIHEISSSWFVSNVSLDGGGGGLTNYRVTPSYRIGSLDISSSTLAYNSASNGNGGAIFADNLTVTNATIRDNLANAGGGVTARYGHALLSAVTLKDNSAIEAGGGVLVGPEPLDGDLRTFELRRSTVSNNAARNGGGLMVYTRAVITESVITENSAVGFGGGANLSPLNGAAIVSYSTVYDNQSSSLGGGLFVGGETRIENTTISGNTANVSGGAIRELIPGGSELSIKYSTIAFNSAAGGGGLSGNAFNLSHTIVANNAASTGPDVNGVVAGSQNLIQDENGLGNSSTITDTIFGMDPLLQPLADNGGFSPTHAITEASPAFDAGAANKVTVTLDQRGESRFQGAAVDLGAFEVQIPVGIWQNPDNPADVNGIDGVSLLDVLAVVNELNQRRFSQPVTGIITSSLGGPPFLDVNGDGMITPLDALQALNAFDVNGENLVASNPPDDDQPSDKELVIRLADLVFGQL